MTLVAGVDSSTQACKVVVRDAASGELRREGRAPHPDGTEVDPAAWWRALEAAVEDAGGLEDVEAVGVGAQQHGMVCLDDAGQVVRPALLWNDTRSAGAAADLVAEGGGPRAWAEAVGSVPVASFTVTKLRWLADHEPAAAGRVAAVCLPHDWLTWRLAGAAGLESLATDRGDASGTGYWSPATGSYRPDLLRLALGADALVPAVLDPAASPGRTTQAARCSPPGPATTWRPRSAWAPGPGDVVVSVGTSGTVFAVSERPAADPSGGGGRVRRRHRAVPAAGLHPQRRPGAGRRRRHARRRPPAALGAGPRRPGRRRRAHPGPVPGGRAHPQPAARHRGRCTGCGWPTPPRPAWPGRRSRGCCAGSPTAWTRWSPRASRSRRVLLIGGGARSEALRRIAPAVLGHPVVVPPAAEYVADGAARQAAWALTGGDEPPHWEQAGTSTHEADPTPAVRERYAACRELTIDQAERDKDAASPDTIAADR